MSDGEYYGAAAMAVIRALMAADEASAAGIQVAVGPVACSLPVNDMPLPAEYVRRSEAVPGRQPYAAYTASSCLPYSVSSTRCSTANS
jgi:hypothetical protein